MPSDAEDYLRHVERVFGAPVSRFQMFRGTRPELKPITVAFFEDFPHPGMLSAVTYGLSLSDHPDWKLGRPELMISVNDADPAWGLAIGDLAEQHRGESPFRWGQTINFGARVSEGSEMSGFFLFAPSLVGRALKRDEYSIPLSRYTVFLAGVYPIHDNEISLYNQIGLERFWKQPGFEPWNVRRRQMT